jgi:hypothetical protein
MSPTATQTTIRAAANAFAVPLRTHSVRVVALRLIGVHLRGVAKVGSQMGAFSPMAF